MPIRDYRRFNFDRPNPHRLITIEDEDSDGSPDVQLPVGEGHEIVRKDELPHRRWRGWIGTFIADNLDMNLDAPWHLADFPRGYTMIRTRRDTTKYRVDYYLFGYGGKRTFDSPREFAFHAVWLYHHPYREEHECECTLCTKRSQGTINRIWFGVPGIIRKADDLPLAVPMKERTGVASGGRQAQLPSRRGVVTWVKMSRSLVGDRQPTIPPTLSERDQDLTFDRPFREGELVWVSIEALVGPEEGEVIKFWPATIERPLNRSRSQAASPTPGQAAAYTVQLLGPETVHTVQFGDILPWRAYTLPTPVLQQIQDPAMPVPVKPLLMDLKGFHPLPLPVAAAPRRPQPSGVRVLPTAAPIPRTYANALGPLSLANRKAEMIQERYCATNEFIDWDPARGQMKSYLGLWWGAERIWTHDLVRLTCTREELLDDGTTRESELLTGSPGAQNRPLLARIRDIVFNDSRQQLRFSAALYELKPLKGQDPPDTFGEGMPKPTAGYRYRRITRQDVFIYLHVQLISGRYNPLPLNSQAHQHLVDDVVNVENLQSLEAGDLDETEVGDRLKEVLALSGLRPEEGDWIHPSIFFPPPRDRKTILARATGESKRITWEMWVARNAREQSQQLDDDGDSAMGDT